MITMMNRKGIITTILVVILCIKSGQGLDCYQHGYCLFGSCPSLNAKIVRCSSNQDSCWKITSPFGTQRGCGDNRCDVQIDASVVNTANVCCSRNLCNSAIQVKMTTITIVFASLIAFVYAWCFE